MGYRMMGALHARVHHAGGQTGQGTVEYVALILLIAVVLGAVVMAGRGMDGGGIADVIVKKLKELDRDRRGRGQQVAAAATRHAGGGHTIARVPAPAPADPRDRPIAVFDSGVGGLTVLHELLVHLPHEDFVYLGDTARFPYGERTPAELERFALEIAEELIARRAKLLVVACNTATAAALPALKARMMETTLGVDVIGVVRPEAVHAVATTRNGRIGLLATPATVASGAYQDAVSAVDSHVDLVSVPCPDLAPIIQAGGAFDDVVVETVRSYCAPLREARVDTVILGCTHYPLVRPLLQRMLGRGVDDRHLRRRARRARSSTRSARATSARSAAARATTRSCARATWRPSARSARASCRCRSARSTTSTCATRRCAA